ncbi:MAG: hypothetical protein V7K21_19240 [Nostoc sp.]|uniref:hypothetical protein n=1 Tax=Nostoc sp. TaxID=1180 RepID=UPI002FFB44B8
MTLDAIAFRPDGSLLIREIINGIKMGKSISLTDDLSNESEEVKSFVNLHRSLVTEQINKPNWGQFNREALMSMALGGILMNSSNQYAVDNLRTIIAPLGYTGLAKEDYPLLQAVWAEIVKGLPVVPSENQIAELKAIALNANMPFTFNEVGLIDEETL